VWLLLAEHKNIVHGRKYERKKERKQRKNVKLYCHYFHQRYLDKGTEGTHVCELSKTISSTLFKKILKNPIPTTAQ
jgi:hypothetical protein